VCAYISPIRRILESSYLFLILGASAIFFAPLIASAYSIKIGWNPNDEPDIEGYILYSRQGSPGPPYEYVDTYPEIDFADPLHPVIKIVDLNRNSSYYFVVTAYDTHGNESDFSNEVSVFKGKGGEAICSSSKESSKKSSVSGGGGGGDGG